MAVQYTGNATATQAPASAPSIGGAPLLNLPVDADAATIASLLQPLKELADCGAWSMQGDLGSIFGQGGDGNVVIDNGSETTLAKDWAFNNLTLSNMSTIKTAGFVVRVRDTLTIGAGSYIHYNGLPGVDGAGGAGGAAGDAGIVYGGRAGGAGGVDGGASAVAGTGTTNSYGGSGGAGGGASGAAGGAAVVPTPGAFYDVIHQQIRTPGWMLNPRTGWAALYSGCGGGGGGKGYTGGGGGGGGAGGGMVVVIARRVVVADALALRALGGAGGDGSGAGGNGGGGGGGGVIFCFYGSWSGPTPAEGANGGAGGANSGGADGVAGSNGYCMTAKVG